MAILRNRTQEQFTIVGSSIMRNRDLKLKDRGLLVTLLSLPDEWEFTLDGLCQILDDGKAAIAASVHKLEKLGYIERHRIRNEAGQLTGTEWEIYETPPQKSVKQKPAENDTIEPKCENQILVDGSGFFVEKPKCENQMLVDKNRGILGKPKCENRMLDKTTGKRSHEPKSSFPTLENRLQSNTNISNTVKKKVYIKPIGLTSIDIISSTPITGDNEKVCEGIPGGSDVP